MFRNLMSFVVANSTESIAWTAVSVGGNPGTSRWCQFQLHGAAGVAAPATPTIHQGYYNSADNSYTDKGGPNSPLPGAHFVEPGTGLVVGAWAPLCGGNTTGV